MRRGAPDRKVTLVTDSVDGGNVLSRRRVVAVVATPVGPASKLGIVGENPTFRIVAVVRMRPVLMTP